MGALGHTLDGETGLVYMRARYIDRVVGRFLSEDPERDGPNWFDYARYNPVNGADFDGRFFLGDVMAGSASDALNEAIQDGNAMVAKQWGENAIQRILMKWADKFMDALWDQDFKDWAFKIVGDKFRLDLVGVDGQYRIAIDLLHDVPHVNLYGWTGPHFTAIGTFFP